VKLVVQVKLQPSPEDARILLETLQTFNSAANRLSQLAWDAGEFNKFALGRLFYAQLRSEFPTLAAQAVIRVISKVVVDLRIVAIAQTSDGTRFAGGHLNGLRGCSSKTAKETADQRHTIRSPGFCANDASKNDDSAATLTTRFPKNLFPPAQRTGRGIALEEFEGTLVRSPLHHAVSESPGPGPGPGPHRRRPNATLRRFRLSYLPFPVQFGSVRYPKSEP
jgi:predicted transposase